MTMIMERSPTSVADDKQTEATKFVTLKLVASARDALQDFQAQTIGVVRRRLSQGDVLRLAVMVAERDPEAVRRAAVDLGFIDPPAETESIGETQ